VCIYLRISYRVYMCVFVHLCIGTQTSQVSLYILTYRYAESTYVTYTHTESSCVYVLAYTRTSVHVCLCSCVYVHRVYMCICECLRICTQSTCACVYISEYTHRE